MITIDRQDAALIEATFSGKLTKEDYAAIIPVFDKAVAEHGKLRIIAIFGELEWITPAAMLADFKWDWQHRHDVEKCAVVVHSKWMEMGTKMVAMIYTGEVKLFDPEQLEEARQWVRQ